MPRATRRRSSGCGSSVSTGPTGARGYVPVLSAEVCDDEARRVDLVRFEEERDTMLILGGARYTVVTNHGKG